MEPCEEYALAITRGKIPAGEPVMLACKRFLKEWKQPAPWLEWNAEKADFVSDFCRTLTVYEALSGGRVAFDPLPWQEFILRQWAGWTILDSALDPLARVTGTRRFRRITLMTGKGSGKSCLIVPFILLSLMEEVNAECYCVALIEAQAQRPWHEAQQMAIWDREHGDGRLAEAFHFVRGRGGAPSLIECKIPGRHGVFRTVGLQSRAPIQSGPIPNLIVAEEWHAHPVPDVVDTLRDGTKLRKHPTTVYLMNAPGKRYGTGYEHYANCVAQLKGAAPLDDAALHMIYELPESELALATKTVKRDGMIFYPPEAQAVWPKPNPSIPHTVRPDYLIDELAETLDEAKGEARKQEIYRLVFSIVPQRGEIDKLWLDWDQWERCLVNDEDIPDESVLREADLYLGMDLADNLCFTGIAAAFRLPDGKLHVRWHAFTPEGTLDDRSQKAGMDFASMALKGHITTCPGGHMDYGLIVDCLERYADTNRYNLRGIAFDMHFFYLISAELNDRGVAWREPNIRKRGKAGIVAARVQSELRRGGMLFFRHPQGGRRSEDPNDFSMDRSMTAFEARYKQVKPLIQIERNELANYMVMCATEHESGAHTSRRRYISLDRQAAAKGRVYSDLMIAMAQAVGLADWRPVEPGSQGRDELHEHGGSMGSAYRRLVAALAWCADLAFAPGKPVRIGPAIDHARWFFAAAPAFLGGFAIVAGSAEARHVRWIPYRAAIGPRLDMVDVLGFGIDIALQAVDAKGIALQYVGADSLAV